MTVHMPGTALQLTSSPGLQVRDRPTQLCPALRACTCCQTFKARLQNHHLIHTGQRDWPCRVGDKQGRTSRFSDPGWAPERLAFTAEPGEASPSGHTLQAPWWPAGKSTHLYSHTDWQPEHSRHRQCTDNRIPLAEEPGRRTSEPGQEGWRQSRSVRSSFALQRASLEGNRVSLDVFVGQDRGSRRSSANSMNLSNPPSPTCAVTGKTLTRICAKVSHPSALAGGHARASSIPALHCQPRRLHVALQHLARRDGDCTQGIALQLLCCSESRAGDAEPMQLHCSTHAEPATCTADTMGHKLGC